MSFWDTYRPLVKFGLLRFTRPLRASRVSIERLSADTSKLDALLNSFESRDKTKPENTWIASAKAHLDEAKRCCAAGFVFAGFENVHAAERDMIAGMSDQERANRAISLRAEIQKKLTGSWRGAAALELLTNPSNNISVSTLREALSHIQVTSQNVYLKIDLLKRQLAFLGFLLALVTLFIVEMGIAGQLLDLDPKSESWLGLAVLFGLLGGALSAMMSVTHTSPDVKIPDAQRSAPLTFVRTLLGGATAIPIYVFLRSGLIQFSTGESELAPILAFAFLGGFSERWFLSKMGQVSGTKQEHEKDNQNQENNDLRQGQANQAQKADGSIEGAVQTDMESDIEPIEHSAFRVGVGMVVATEDGKVLQCERADVAAGAWQFPQGGIEPEESPEEAAIRELAEEIGVAEENLELKGQATEWLTYELPAEWQNAKVGRGQTQKWFLFRISQPGIEQIVLSGEFRNYRWVSFRQAVEDVADFRKQIYSRLKDEFAELIEDSP